MKKIAIITGGTKGIGKSLVSKFASEKWNIITCSRNKTDLNKLQSEIKDRYSTLIYTYPADLSKKEEVANFIKFIYQTTQKVEILINNVGIFIPGLVHEEKEGTLETMLNTNLYSAYYMSRGIIPRMKKNRKGYIFNLCSVASLKAYENGGSYSISKFALYGMSQAIREELKEFNVKVTSIMAGATKTPSWGKTDVPNERFMKPEDIAETIYNTYQLSDRTVIEELIMRPQLGDI